MHDLPYTILVDLFRHIESVYLNIHDQVGSFLFLGFLIHRSAQSIPLSDSSFHLSSASPLLLTCKGNY